MTNGSLMKVKSIAECSPLSILQYFWPALFIYTILFQEGDIFSSTASLPYGPLNI